MIEPTLAYNPTPDRYRGGRLTRHDRARMKLEGQAQQAAWMASPEGQSRREAAMAAMAAASLVVAAMPRRRPLRCRVARAP